MWGGVGVLGGGLMLVGWGRMTIKLLKGILEKGGSEFFQLFFFFFAPQPSF
jgi:hypothetical protein